MPLLSGFNLVMWTGPDTAVADAVAGLSDALVALYTYDTLAQRFRSFQTALPLALNSATVLKNGDGVWLQVSRAMNWNQPTP